MENNQSATPSWKDFNRPWYEKLGLTIWNYIKNVGLLLWSVLRAIPFKIWAGIKSIGRGFHGLWFRFVKGDWRTKMSYLIMGFGCFSRGKGQILKGILWFLVEALFVVFMVFLGAPNLGKFGTLGTIKQQPAPDGIGFIDGDHSIKILIFSVMSIMLMVFMLVMYIKNTKVAYETQKTAEAGKKLSGLKEQLNYVMNDGYHVTSLLLPVTGILLVTILPLLINILVAFTSYVGWARPPAHLVSWVFFDNFVDVFGQSYGSIIWRTLGWTLVWAFFATFTNFFFGMFLAMMINRKSIKIKAFWRVCFIIVIAIPDFVTLLMMSKFFSYSNDYTQTGAFNKILNEWFHLNTLFNVNKVNIDWFGTATGNTTLARAMVIIVNMWRGMPFTMLATSGILMNIPEDLYESSRIDGAGPVRRFISITFPYIMFVMGPQLITTFTGNINNFNVIFFLTGGGPNTFLSNGKIYSSTNLLITWLYSLTMTEPDRAEYGNAAVIGLFTFLISSFFALIVFNSSKSVKQEDTFQ